MPTNVAFSLHISGPAHISATTILSIRGRKDGRDSGTIRICFWHSKSFTFPLQVRNDRLIFGSHSHLTCTCMQGGPSGRRTLFAVIKLKVPPQYKLLILKCNSYFNVIKSLSSTRWTTLYCNLITRLGNRCARVSVFGSKSSVFLAVCGQIWNFF